MNLWKLILVSYIIYPTNYLSYYISQKNLHSASSIYLVYSFGKSTKYKDLSFVTIANLLFLTSKPICLNFSFTLILDKHKSLSQYLFRTFMKDMPDFVFLPSTVFVKSLLENPYCLVLMQVSTAFLISKICMLDFDEVQAKMYYVGWKTIWVISALLFPLFNS